MESQCNMNYSDYLSRKRRGKKKRKTNNLRLKMNSDDVANESDNSVSVESTENPNLTDENESEGEASLENCGISSPASVSDEVVKRVTTDGMMISPPKILLSPEPENSSGIKKIEYHENLKDDTNSIIEPHGNIDNLLPFNKRALSKNASTYELEKFEKNALIIFNQENIEGFKPRLGTEQDVVSLCNTFKRFGFEVVEHKDLAKDDVFKELRAFSERDFTDYGCIVVAVLTHGSNNGLLRAKDQQYSEIEIINHFKAYDKPTLVTKPKILMIQACRGTKSMQGVLVLQSGKIRKDLDEDMEPYILPVESDILVLHSSYIGNPSHRDEIYGSWFIQSLCNKIDQLSSTHDLESILTEVKREVAIDKFHEEYNRRTFEMDINKQMPVSTSTLIRKLYFKKYKDVSPVIKASPNMTESSRNDVLDNAAPNTPLLIQFGPCSCFLEHYIYIKNCLKYFLEDYPEDETAQSFLDVANSFEDGVEYNNAKEKMSKAICKHLSNNAKYCQYFKYLYFYKH